MRKVVLINIVILLTAFGIMSYADTYKYMDENGVIHFTNIPQVKNYKKITTEKSAGPDTEYDQIIRNKSLKYNIEPSLIKAVITVESNWNPKAVSKKGALGLMQLMPSTARDMRINNPFDPEENIEGGTRYLRHLLNQFNGDLSLALAAYNAGPAKVEKSGGIPSIPETEKFVIKIISRYKEKSNKKISRIYKVTYDDGTILYTNTPFLYKQYKLSNF